MKDRRQRIVEGALFSPDLSYAEKTFIVVVATIKPEYLDGERRHGSKAMGHDGKFALHLDYLAGALNTSAEGVRKIQRSLKSKRFLDMVHEGRFGRPTTWQAMVVRGAKNGSLTSGRKGTPYAMADWFIRGAEKAPLAYKTPTDVDHEPPSGASPHLPSGVVATRFSTEGLNVGTSVTACPWHQHFPCPADCKNAPETTADRRRTA